MRSKQNAAYLLVVGVALAAGLAVAAGVSMAIGADGAGLPGAATDLVGLVAPVAAGLTVVAVTVELGLRRLGRSRAKSGW